MDREETAVTAAMLFLRCRPFEEFSYGRVGVIHPDEGCRYRLLGLEILVYKNYGSLALVYVLLIFRVGEETNLARFSVFNLGETGYDSLGVSVNCTVEKFREVFSFYFHSSVEN